MTNDFGSILIALCLDFDSKNHTAFVLVVLLIWILNYEVGTWFYITRLIMTPRMCAYTHMNTLNSSHKHIRELIIFLKCNQIVMMIIMVVLLMMKIMMIMTMMMDDCVAAAAAARHNCWCCARCRCKLARNFFL